MKGSALMQVRFIEAPPGIRIEAKKKLVAQIVRRR